MEIIAQLSAVIGVLLIISGMVWLYVRIKEEEFNFLYLVEFSVLFPVFALRHWEEAKNPMVVFLLGMVMVIGGYSHGW